MSRRQSRREFVAASAAAGAFSVADLSFLRRLSPVSAADAQIDPNKVWLGGDIEPLVRLLEETPREQLLERVAERIAAVEKLYLDGLMSTRDAVEGLDAFIAKRPAKWEHC